VVYCYLGEVGGCSDPLWSLLEQNILQLGWLSSIQQHHCSLCLEIFVAAEYSALLMAGQWKLVGSIVTLLQAYILYCFVVKNISSCFYKSQLRLVYHNCDVIVTILSFYCSNESPCATARVATATNCVKKHGFCNIFLFCNYSPHVGCTNYKTIPIFFFYKLSLHLTCIRAYTRHTFNGLFSWTTWVSCH